MIETRTIRISGKIITKETLIQFADVLEYTHNNELAKDKDVRNTLRYSIDTEDESTYESDSGNIFESNNLGSISPIISAEMRLFSGNDQADISFRLRQSETTDSSNRITIRGRDSILVNAVTKKFEDILKNCEKSPDFIRRYYWLIAIVMFIGIILLIFAFLRIVFNIVCSIGWLDLAAIAERKETSLESVKSTIKWIILWLSFSLSVFPSLPLYEAIKRLWPNIEFQIGPAYSLKYVRKRRKSWFLASIILGPIVGSAIELLYQLLF